MRSQRLPKEPRWICLEDETVKHGVSRRDFLGGLGAGLAAPYFLTSKALVAAPAASDTVRVGHIGVGGMGSGHLRRYCNNAAYPSVAICDVDTNHRTRAAKRVGDHCKTYKDFRDLLDQKDIDAVVIATPDHWHIPIAIAACKAGKDVYCEKPLTLTIGEGRELVKTVRRYGRVFQTGSQQRSSREFRFACEMVRSGRIGEIKTVHVSVGGPSRPCYLPAEPVPAGLDWDMWLGPAPVRPYHHDMHPFRWRSFRDYSGGGMTDWGAHHFDITQWGLGMDGNGPVEIHPPQVTPNKKLTYKYANGIEVYHWPGSCRGILFTGTKGKVEVSRGFLRTDPADLMRTPTRPDEVHLYKSPGHARDWQQCMWTRQKPICDVEIGFRSVSVCHLGNICYWLKRSLRWDPVKEEFIGDAEANRWLDRPRRAPWHI